MSTGQKSVGGHGAPFRAPCGEWRPVQHAPCFQHTKNSEKNLPEWKNTTTVPDWRPTSDPNYQANGIPPYPRKSDGGAIYVSGTGCIDSGGVDPMWPADDGSGDCPGPCGSPCHVDENQVSTPGEQLCNTWFSKGPDSPFPYNACRHDDATHVTVDFNCYEKTGATVDHSKCRKIGFKNVQARKSWHGSWGWMSHERIISWFPGVPSDSCPATCECAYEPMRPTPDQTKYLQLDVRASAFSSLDGSTVASASCTRSCSVDRYSGVSTLTSCSDTGDALMLSNLQGFLGNKIFTPSLLAEYGRQQVIPFQPGGAYNTGTAVATVTGCEPSYSAEAHDNSGGGTLATLQVDIQNGSYLLRNYALPNILLLQEVITIENAVTSWVIDTYSTDGSEHVHSEVTATLRQPYAALDVYNDCNALLHLWKLDDDALYPWRVDEYVGVAPLITYDESPATEPSTVGVCPGTIPYVINGNGRTGRILGAPLPYPGAGPHFDFTHLTYRSCNPAGVNDARYIYSHGAWAHNAPPSPIPPYTLDNSTVRKIIDHTEARGVGGLVITITVDSDSNINDNDLCVVCGGFTFDGAYVVEKVDGTHFKLHTQFDGVSHYRIILDVDSPPVPAACADGIIARATLNNDATFYYTGDTTDLAVPQSATQWTQNWELGPITAGDIPAGASMIFQNGTLYMQKWAEIKVPRPSMNFARPCGIDRYQINHDLVKCVQTVVDSNQPAVVSVIETSGLSNGDKVICCGCGIDGLYTVHINDATHIRLDNFQPISDLYTAPDEVCSTGIIAKLRYPNAPVLCHPVKVVGATKASPIVISTSEPTYLVTGDTVTISDVTGNIQANGTFTIKSKSQTEFELNGTSGLFDYTGGGTITTDGTADYGWDDNQPKGEFMYAFFNFNFRDHGEADRMCNQAHNVCHDCSSAPIPDGINCVQVSGSWQSDVRLNQSINGLDRSVNLFKFYQPCLHFDRCEPQVMACIEQGGSETFAGKPSHIISILPYGASLDPDHDTVSFFLDERYGARWQAAFFQSVTDPFWEQPPKPCFDDTFTGDKIQSLCAQHEDDGSCMITKCDGTTGSIYYAHEPLVENLFTVPAGAPPLYPGIHIGYLSWSDLQSATPPDGNLLRPPVGTGYAPEVGGVDPTIPIPATTPWGTVIREWQCICKSGDFSADYIENMSKYNC